MVGWLGGEGHPDRGAGTPEGTPGVDSTPSSLPASHSWPSLLPATGYTTIVPVVDLTIFSLIMINLLIYVALD